MLGFSADAVNHIKPNEEDQVYWVKHSRVTFQAPEVRQEKRAKEITLGLETGA